MEVNYHWLFDLGDDAVAVFNKPPAIIEERLMVLEDLENPVDELENHEVEPMEEVDINIDGVEEMLSQQTSPALPGRVPVTLAVFPVILSDNTFSYSHSE